MATYPDTRDALFELIDGREFAGKTVAAFYQLPIDFAAQSAETPSVLIYTTGGTEGYVDQVDRATLEVYAPGTSAVEVARAIKDEIAGDPAIDGMSGKAHETAAGYLDGVKCDVTPYDVPYQSDLVNLARTTYLVTSRPTD